MMPQRIAAPPAKPPERPAKRRRVETPTPPPASPQPASELLFPILPFTTFVHAYPALLPPNSQTAYTPMPNGQGFHFAFAGDDGVAHLCMVAEVAHMQEAYARLYLAQHPDWQPDQDPTVYVSTEGQPHD